MHELNQDQINRILSTLNGWAPSTIDDYLQILARDEQGNATTLITNKDKAAKLAFVLVNINSSEILNEYLHALSRDSDADDLLLILSLFKNPLNIQPDPQLRGHEDEIRAIIANRFQAFADRIIKDFGLSPVNRIPSAPPLELLNPIVNLNYIANFQSSIASWKHLYDKRKRTLQVAVEFSWWIATGLLRYSWAMMCISSFSHDRKTQTSTGEVALVLFGISLGIFIASPLLIILGIGVIYGFEKWISSIAKMRDIFNRPGHAIYGFLRFGVITSGTLASVGAGVLAGALIGSMFPIIGTTLGAVIGGVMVGAFGLGVVSLISKYVFKSLAYLFYKLTVWNEELVKPSNPARYRLTQSEKRHLQNMDVNMSEFNRLLKDLNDMKHAIPFLARINSKETSRMRKEINILVQDLKRGVIDTIRFELVKNNCTYTYSLFNSTPRALEARNLAYFSPSVA